jgi:hypothetical protein
MVVQPRLVDFAALGFDFHGIHYPEKPKGLRRVGDIIGACP